MERPQDVELEVLTNVLYEKRASSQIALSLVAQKPAVSKNQPSERDICLALASMAM